MDMKTTRKKGDRFEVYVTKYALTKGVMKRLVEDVGNGYVATVDPGTGGYGVYGPADWQMTEDGAVKRVREMLAAKRKSLAKRLARLDAIEKDPLGATKQAPVFESAEEVFESYVGKGDKE